MPKHKGKGGKSRRRGKGGEGDKRELVFKEDGQEYGQVLKCLVMVVVTACVSTVLSVYVISVVR